MLLLIAVSPINQPGDAYGSNVRFRVRLTYDCVSPWAPMDTALSSQELGVIYYQLHRRRNIFRNSSRLQMFVSEKDKAEINRRIQEHERRLASDPVWGHFNLC